MGLAQAHVHSPDANFAALQTAHSGTRSNSGLTSEHALHTARTRSPASQFPHPRRRLPGFCWALGPRRVRFSIQIAFDLLIPSANISEPLQFKASILVICCRSMPPKTIPSVCLFLGKTGPSALRNAPSIMLDPHSTPFRESSSAQHDHELRAGPSVFPWRHPIPLQR